MINPNVRTTFDHYGRYFFIAKMIEANRTKETLNILDVGGYSGNLSEFLPKDKITILDTIDAKTDNYIKGDALRMPFKHKEFDVVVTADTLEHIPSDKRSLFLKNCYETSKDFMVVAAPFETGQTAKIEKEVNEIYKTLSDKDYPWLREHIQNGLPNLKHIEEWARSNKLNYFSLPNNNLYEWRALISQYFFLENFTSIEAQRDYFERSDKYNKTVNRYPAEPPAYRYVIALSKNKIREPNFSKPKMSTDFTSSLPLIKYMKKYITEIEGLVNQNTFIEASIRTGAYVPLGRFREALLNDHLNNSINELNTIKSSVAWKLVSHICSSSIFGLFYKIIQSSCKIYKYKVYFYLPNLYWRLHTGIPAYGRKKFNSLKFNNSKSPRVSIIIPVYGKAALTLNCLYSIQNLKTKYEYEVILIDDHSPDVSPKLFSKIPGIIYHRNQSNKGYTISCNTGADLAKGEYLVFLNNDTHVDVNWLDPLIKNLKNKEVGLVGSKLLYPDGKLQEAGGIIFSNGSGWNYGRNDNPNKPEYCYKREVDYISGASIAIRNELFKQLGGYDEIYAPAYYEDTDLAFSVRNAGYKVLYEPSSKLIHIEGASSGTDLKEGVKKYQLINQEKFSFKWKKTLETKHYGTPSSLIKARDRGSGKMVLIIDHYVPEPDKDSGSVRMSSLIGVLQNMGYAVTFWPQNLNQSEPYTRNLQEQGVEVMYGVIDFLEFSEERGHFYDLVILSRPSVAPSYLDIVRALYTDAKIIYDTVDLAYIRIARQAQLENNPQLKDISTDWKKVELGIVERTDTTLVVSNFEKREILKLIPTAKIKVVSNIHTIKAAQKFNVPFETRKDLLFIGGFAHQPNVDAVLWFSKEIMPLLTKYIPDIKLLVIGSNPPQSVTNLSSKNIRILGYVEDVAPYFSKSKVFVAPLRYGAGVKGKIGQAVEYGLPVVSTEIGIEGMHLKNERSCLVANDAEDIAQAIIKLYSNKKLWLKLSNESQKVLEKYFSPQVAQNSFSQIVKDLE